MQETTMYVFTEKTGLQQSRHVHRDVERFRKLSYDLQRIGAGASPTEQELDAAPLIENWTFHVKPAPALIGTITGHPLLSNRSLLSMTSEVWVDGSASGWVRTFSRYYRLGSPLAASVDLGVVQNSAD